MWLIRWLTTNWADTTIPDPPDLQPLELPLPSEAAIARIVQTIAGLPRWRVESTDPTGFIRATRRTPLWGFTDDITLRLEAVPTGTRLQARSQSRLGKGDLGQNRRNILELFRALRQSG